jgi:hypothetical protein
VPVIGWNHGGVRETLAALFPEGAIPPGDRAELFERSLAFLARRPKVPENTAFGLRESMRKTMAVYDSALQEKTR